MFQFNKQSGLNLPYSYAGVGYMHRQEYVRRPDTQNRSHQWMYGDFQWIQTHSGKGELCVNGQRHIVGEGKGMLLFPNVPHTYRPIDGLWETDWVIFRGKFLPDFMENLMGATTITVYDIAESELLSRRIGALYEAASSADAAKEVSCSVLVYEILMNIYRSVSQNNADALCTHSARLESVMNTIHRDYALPLTLDSLALEANLTPQYLCRLFKKVMSKTVFDYLTEVRIQKSKEFLLCDKNMRINEIALAAGFNSASYFCRIFRRYEGMSPEMFREGSC